MRLRLGILALTASAVLAAPSLAADHTATLSASAPSFSWDGAAATSLSDPVGFGVPGCGDDGHKCEDILLNLAAPGDLKIALESDGGAEIPEPSGQVCENGSCGAVQDFDGTLFKSNAAGEASGEPVNSDCASTYASEACEAKGLSAGYYLLHVDYFTTLEGSYKGTATLTTTGPAPAAAPPAAAPAPSSEPAPAPAPASQPAPSSTPAPTKAASKPAAKKTSKRAACTKKAKKIKNKRKRAKALKKCKKIKK